MAPNPVCVVAFLLIAVGASSQCCERGADTPCWPGHSGAIANWKFETNSGQMEATFVLTTRVHGFQGRLQACSASARVFETPSFYDGAAIGGIAGADAICNSVNSGCFKAMMVDETGCSGSPCRRASLSGFAGDGQIDWVLRPNTNYCRHSDTTFLFSTDANGLIQFPLANPVITSGGYAAWGGVDSNWVTGSGNTCSGWTSTSGNGIVNKLDLTSSSFLAYSTFACSNPYKIMCVEQTSGCSSSPSVTPSITPTVTPSNSVSQTPGLPTSTSSTTASTSTSAGSLPLSVSTTPISTSPAPADGFLAVAKTVSQSRTLMLTIGLGVGLGGPLLVLLIASVVLCLRDRKLPKREPMGKRFKDGAADEDGISLSDVESAGEKTSSDGEGSTKSSAADE